MMMPEAMLIILAILAVGEIVSTLTKARIPSIFVSAIIFLVAFWMGLPANIGEVSGLVQLAPLVVFMVITDMGTMIDLKELLANWKTVTIGVGSIVGIVALAYGVGIVFFDSNLVVSAIPPLTGGLVATEIMRSQALNLGYPEYAVLAIIVYMMQGFFAFILSSYFLKRESAGLLKNREHIQAQLAQAQVAATTTKKQTWITIPEKYKNSYTHLVLLLAFTYVAYLIGNLFAMINPNLSGVGYIACLVMGMLGRGIGLLDRQPLEQAKCMGFVMPIIMANALVGLSYATVEMLKSIFIPFIAMIILAIVGIILASYLIAKLLKYPKDLGIAIGLNCLMGFPGNYIVTKEVVDAVAQTDEEKKLLTEVLMPKMLIGGFTTVSIGSVVVASIFVQFLR